MSWLSSHEALYQAPEVIATLGANRTQASDVWQLGVLLFALGCGKLPFSTVNEIVDHHDLPWSNY